jgi:hypothetical protein
VDISNQPENPPGDLIRKLFPEMDSEVDKIGRTSSSHEHTPCVNPEGHEGISWKVDGMIKDGWRVYNVKSETGYAGFLVGSTARSSSSHDLWPFFAK